MKKYQKGLMVMLIAAILVVAGCSSNSKKDVGGNTPSNETSEKQYKVGLTLSSLSVPIFAYLANQAEEHAKAQGAKLTTQDANNDPNKQITAIENFISSGMDAIIINPVDPRSLTDVVNRAMEKGIKVVTYGVEIENYDFMLSVDNYALGKAIGEQAGNWIKDNLGGIAEVAVLNQPTVPEIVRREQGIIDAINEIVPNAKIVANAPGVSPSEGMKSIENVLQAYPNLKVIAAIGDGGALGAVEAVKVSGKEADDFFIVGADGTDEAIKKINEGSVLRSSIDLDGHNHGTQLVDMAMKAVKGEEQDKVSYSKLLPVTKDNVADFLQYLK